MLSNFNSAQQCYHANASELCERFSALLTLLSLAYAAQLCSAMLSNSHAYVAKVWRSRPTSRTAIGKLIEVKKLSISIKMIAFTFHSESFEKVWRLIL